MSGVAKTGDPDETLMTSAFSDSATHSVDVADLDGETEKLVRPSLSSLIEPERAKSVAPGAAPSQDRSTRQINNGPSLGDEEEITGLFNRAAPEMPQLNAPGKQAQEGPTSSGRSSHAQSRTPGGSPTSPRPQSQASKRPSMAEVTASPPPTAPSGRTMIQAPSNSDIRLVIITSVSIVIGGILAFILR